MKASRQTRIIELIKFDKKIAKSNPVIGVDEAGRGPVAGPVTACALYFPEINKEIKETLKYLDDSKKFSSNPKLREELSEEIKKHAIYCIAEASVREIEKINILQASLLAMHRACDGVISQLKLDKKPIILVDGRFSIPKYNVEQIPVIKGDSKSAAIAAASILAKVHRDNFMKELAKKFPQYCWHQNKGYPTAAHIEAIREHGQCKWHRKTFICKVLQP
ncbi:MAG: ribonuclease HII [Candidatus Gastranaerophilales bacterium]|nr:ribonuclease HII [Candidatus Gastranaerophilales bacterium]